MKFKSYVLGIQQGRFPKFQLLLIILNPHNYGLYYFGIFSPKNGVLRGPPPRPIFLYIYILIIIKLGYRQLTTHIIILLNFSKFGSFFATSPLSAGAKTPNLQICGSYILTLFTSFPVLLLKTLFCLFTPMFWPKIECLCISWFHPSWDTMYKRT